MKAYMSDPSDSEELRYCLRKGKDAGAELAKILADTEPSSGCLWDHGHAGWFGVPVMDVLAESLAAFVADGGEADQQEDAAWWGAQQDELRPDGPAVQA